MRRKFEPRVQASFLPHLAQEVKSGHTASRQMFDRAQVAGHLSIDREMQDVLALAKSYLGKGKRVPCNYCRVMFAQTAVHRHERENCPKNGHRRQKKRRYKYCESCHIFILATNFSRHL